MTSEWFVYMVRCVDGSFYTGITKELERRVVEHNQCNNKGAKYTRARRPVTLVYHEAHASRSSASRREYDLKRMSRESKLAMIDQQS